VSKSFRGGIHPGDHKSATASKAIEVMPVPSKLIIPLRQHIGAPCEPTVAKGDLVKKGQIIADIGAFVSSPIHASTSGKVLDIIESPHPVFGKCMSIILESDGQDEWISGISGTPNWESLSNEELGKCIRSAGIVGMGGATFPTHIKLNPPKDKALDSFILNAAECEPFLTADHRLMLEYPQEIVTGVLIAMKMLGVPNGYIGVEDNKPDAIEAMKKAFAGVPGVQVVALPTKYPQGGEKMLIKAILNREVPSGALPVDAGAVVQNVGTVIAIADAVIKGLPMVERVVTISGGSVVNPKNVMVRIGTTFSDVVDFCGGFNEIPEKIIMGGPMMGFAQSSLDVPVIKGVSGILGLSKSDVNSGKEGPCIRCGRCVDACPMSLVPSMLSILGQKGFWQDAKEEYNLMDCIECGSCVYVCPAKRNIVQYVRYCKALNAANPPKK